MTKSYRKSRVNRKTKSSRKNRKVVRKTRRMRGGFVGMEENSQMAHMPEFKSPFVTNMIRY